jgi:hypothetical protein
MALCKERMNTRNSIIDQCFTWIHDPGCLPTAIRETQYTGWGRLELSCDTPNVHSAPAVVLTVAKQCSHTAPTLVGHISTAMVGRPD